MDAITTPINRLAGPERTQSGTKRAREPGAASQGLSHAHIAILKILAAQAVREHRTLTELPKPSE